MLKQVMPPPADFHRERASGPREVPNRFHPLNMNCSYNTNDPKHIKEEAIRRSKLKDHCDKMDKIWGKDWAKI